jgi:membrane protease YdiL (CAAX protease family)
MGPFAQAYPFTFALISTLAWLVSLTILMGLASAAFRRPYGDGVAGFAARLAVTACVLLLLGRLGWLRSSGVLRMGSRRAWLLAGGGAIYLAGASLYAFFGAVAFDMSSVRRWPDSGAAITAHAAAALSEEVQFRGLVLYALARAWGHTRQGLLGSAAVTSVLFAALHMTQVFANGLPLASALLLTVQTCVVSFWWGALVLVGGSIWPAVMLHLVVNATVAVQAFSAPMVEPASLGYRLLLWFSMPLAALGAAAVARHPAAARRGDQRPAVPGGV